MVTPSQLVGIGYGYRWLRKVKRYAFCGFLPSMIILETTHDSKYYGGNLKSQYRMSKMLSLMIIGGQYTRRDHQCLTIMCEVVTS